MCFLYNLYLITVKVSMKFGLGTSYLSQFKIYPLQIVNGQNMNSI